MNSPFIDSLAYAKNRAWSTVSIFEVKQKGPQKENNTYAVVAAKKQMPQGPANKSLERKMSI